MKKFLAASSAIALLLPSFVLAAAYNDVSLDTNVVLNVGGIEVDVSGSGATIASITVNSSNFTVDMQANSSITVTAPNRNELNASVQDAAGQTVTCDGSTSSVTIKSGTTQTVTFTPSSTLCSSSSSSSSTSGGNGPPLGGGSAVVSAQQTTASSAQTTGTAVATGNMALIAQLQAQLNALLAQIAALTGKASPSAGFHRNLTVGSTGADVMALQVYLNGHGFALAKTGPGSPGRETTKFGALTRAALAKWQASVGVSPAMGYFGPKTRAYIATHP